MTYVRNIDENNGGNNLKFFMESIDKYKRQRVGKYILKALQSLGGSANRGKIKEEIASDEEIDLSYNQVFGSVISKNGGSYVPFNYDFNYSIKELLLCEYVENYSRGDDITLTEKGRATDYKLFPNKEEEQFLDNYWKNKAKNSNTRNVQDKDINKVIKHDEEFFDDWKQKVLEKIKQFSPKKFESFSRLLLSKMGIKFDPEKGINMSADHGIDGFGYFETDEFRALKVVIQCKKFTDNAVSEPDVDKFKGVMTSFNADYGIFITTSYFTKQAQFKATVGNNTVTLIDGQRLIELIEKYKLHVTPVTTYSLDDYYSQQD